MTSVLSFSVLKTKKQKNGKTKIDFRFIVFRCNNEKKWKNENRLPFCFSFNYEKTKKRKNEIDFRFIVFRFNYEKTKNGKTEIDFRFIVFRFMYEKTKKTKTNIDFRFIVFVSLIRACVANVDIKMFRLCTPGGGGGQSSE